MAGATVFAAKWGVGPTFAAVLIGGTTLGATVGVFQFTSLGSALGIVSESVQEMGPSMKEGQQAVREKVGSVDDGATDTGGNPR